MDTIDPESFYATYKLLWAPVLPFPPEMVTAFRRLQILRPYMLGNPGFGRLWRAPKKPEYRLEQVRLRAGDSEKGELLVSIFRRQRWQLTDPSRPTWGSALLVPEYLRGTEEHELRTLLQDQGLALIKTFLTAPEPMLAQGGQLTGKCGICGRMLTDPDSVARGIGPECIKGLQH